MTNGSNRKIDLIQLKVTNSACGLSEDNCKSTQVKILAVRRKAYASPEQDLTFQNTTDARGMLDRKEVEKLR